MKRNKLINIVPGWDFVQEGFTVKASPGKDFGAKIHASIQEIQRQIANAEEKAVLTGLPNEALEALLLSCSQELARRTIHHGGTE